jgi:sulfur relay (sulfurtransferase) DsrC/TusE family protein
MITATSLGTERHQKRILFHIFFSDFPKDVILKLESQHFTDEKHKIIFTLIKEYVQEYNSLPSLRTIGEIIKKNKTHSKEQRNVWITELSAINNDYKKLLEGKDRNDFDYIKSDINNFIKVQELKILSENDIKLVVDGNNMNLLNSVLEKLRTIINIGSDDIDPDDVEDFDSNIFLQRYRDHIPTGLIQIDRIITGLPKGKLGMIIAAQGVGKSSLLAYLTVNAFKLGKKVLHIIFSENEKDDIKLLIATALTGISFSDAKKDPKRVEKLAKEKITEIKTIKMGVIKIMRFPSNEKTIPELKNWVTKYQQKIGYKFDQINFDYVDEVKSHISNPNNPYQSEKEVVGAMLDMFVEFDNCGWTATQAKKESNNKKELDLFDCGGSVAKVKKAQVVITVGRDAEDRNNNRATFHLAKSNISPSGHFFRDSLFDTAHMNFELTPPSGTVIEVFDDETLDTEYEVVTDTRELLLENNNNTNNVSELINSNF